MAAIGNIIKELSYTTPLIAGASWQSEPQQLGIWNCVTILINTDADGYLTVSWSPYGKTFDLSAAYNVYAGVPFYITLTPISAWCKLTYNNGVANQTLFHLSSYGTTTNNATTLVVPPGTNFNIKNLPLGAFYGVETFSDVPQINYSFDYADPVASWSKIRLNTWKLPYPDIRGYSLNNYDMRVVSGVLCNRLQPIGTGSDYVWSTLQGRSIRAKRGQGMRARFTGQFYVYPSRNGPNPPLEMIGLGYTNMTSGALVDGFYFGYVDTSATLPQGFGIAVVSNGTKSTILQNQWNVDRCDGTQSMPDMTWSNLNMFQISTQGFGAGTTTFAIENPRTGVIYPVHQLFLTTTGGTQPTSPSTKSQPLAYSLGFSMGGNYTVGSTPLIDNDWIGTTGMCISRQGPLEIRDVFTNYIIKNYATSATETAVVKFRNAVAWYSINNRVPVMLKAIYGGPSSSKVVIRLYMYNSSTTSGIYSDVDIYNTPMQYNTNITGTVTDGYRVCTLIMSTQTTEYDLVDYDLVLDVGDYLTCTVEQLTSSNNLSLVFVFVNL